MLMKKKNQVNNIFNDSLSFKKAYYFEEDPVLVQNQFLQRKLMKQSQVMNNSQYETRNSIDSKLTDQVSYQQQDFNSSKMIHSNIGRTQWEVPNLNRDYEHDGDENDVLQSSPMLEITKLNIRVKKDQKQKTSTHFA